MQHHLPPFLDFLSDAAKHVREGLHISTDDQLRRCNPYLLYYVNLGLITMDEAAQLDIDVAERLWEDRKPWLREDWTNPAGVPLSKIEDDILCAILF